MADRTEIIRKKQMFGPALLLCLLLLCAVPCLGQNFETKANASAGAGRRIAVDPVGHSEGYSCILYDNKNGLPTAEANAIAETGDGFIWIGSYSGLIRFDGDNFVRMDSTSGIANVMCLYVDSRDRLWVGTNDSGFAVLEQGEFQIRGKKDGLPAASVRAIAEDGDGCMYVATTGGLVKVSPEMEISPMGDRRTDGSFITDLRTDDNGCVYGLTNAGDVFAVRGGKLVDFIGQEAYRFDSITTFFPDPEDPDYAYIQSGDLGFYRASLSKGFSHRTKIDAGSLGSIQRIEYIDGRLWLCAGNGIGVLDEDGLQVLTNVPMNSSVSSMITDYEGNLWFTSSRQGVMKIVPNRFSDINERWDLPEAVVNTTCLYQGKLFIGTDEGLIVVDDTGAVPELLLKRRDAGSGSGQEETDLLELLKGCRIRSVSSDKKGRLWITTWQGPGVLCCSNGELTIYSESDGLVSNRIRSVAERKDGSLLAFGGGGVSVLRDGQVIESCGEGSGLPNTEVLTAIEGTDGNIILGTDGGGIYVLDGSDRGKILRHISTDDGLGSDIVMRIKRDPTRKIYWIVTGNSLAWMTEDYQVTTIHDFPYSNNFDLYVNTKGEVWILSSNGIYVCSAERLMKNEERDPIHYSRDNGLPCITTPNSYSFLSGEGDLYIAGVTGVTKVNIEKTFEDVSDLKVSVPYLEADGVEIYPDEKGVFRLSSDVQKLTIYSYIYNFSLTNPQVSYYLEGFDREAVTVSRSDLTPVSYTNLPGGNYYFILQLNDPMGHGTKKVSIPIIKAKAWYEKPWFYILAGLTAAGLAAGGTSLYVRRKMRILEKKHREVEEKERISTELRMARQIQEGMLPGAFPAFPDRTEFDIYATMEPAKEVGGDFYDFFMIDEDHLGILIADVSGKGIPAALFMMISKVILQSCAMLGRSAGDILTKTNEALCSRNRLEMFVTVWLGILEISTGRLTAANAGHEYPVLKQGDSFELLKDRHGLVIGGMEGIRYQEYTLTLSPGDKLFIYTDGIPEAINRNQELFGIKRMMDALNRHPEGTPEEILSGVRRSVGQFAGDAEQFDDMTMLCLEYRGPAGSGRKSGSKAENRTEE